MRVFTRKTSACLTMIAFIAQWPASATQGTAHPSDVLSQSASSVNITNIRGGIITAAFSLAPSVPAPNRDERVRPVLPRPGIRVLGPAMLHRPLPPHYIPTDPLAVQALAAANKLRVQPIQSHPVIHPFTAVTPTPLFPTILPSTQARPSPGRIVQSISKSGLAGRQLIMQPLITGTNYYLTVQADHPVAYYRMDDSGSTLKDYGPNGLNGNYGSAGTHGVASVLSTDTDTAFQGVQANSNSFATVASNSLLQPTSAVSVEAWILTPDANPQSNARIVSYGNATVSPYDAYGIGYGDGSSDLCWFGVFNNAQKYTCPYKTQFNSKYHFVGTYDGTALKFYVNGSSAGSTAASGSISHYDGHGLGIGDAVTENDAFGGVLDEVAIYNYALSSSQVAHHYQVGAGVAPSPTPTPMPTPATGINHWWTYEEDSLGGVGRYMVNVANGNLIVQSDDMAIPNKGIALAFRRTYNSQSKHDYTGSDGSIPSNYGEGWTNTFDAHLGYNSQLGLLSVYDIDGARYDYTSNGTGCWSPPAGQFATLCSDGANGYFWTKKTGTYYYFYSPVQTTNNAGFAGRVYEICGRNHNNYLAFHGASAGIACFTTAPPSNAGYYFDSGTTSASNLNKIVVGAEDGRTATLLFGNGPGGQRLLSWLLWPDGTQVTYAFDSSAQLKEVDEPTNNSSGTLPKQQYFWLSGHQLQQVSSPRYVADQTGSYYTFSYSAGQLNSVHYLGLINPSINDGYSSGTLQPAPAPTGITNYRTVTLTYNSGSTTWGDTDGHQTTYTYDSTGKITQLQSVTGDPQGGVTSLTTTQTWDAQNNLISATDHAPIKRTTPTITMATP